MLLWVLGVGQKQGMCSVLGQVWVVDSVLLVLSHSQLVLIGCRMQFLVSTTASPESSDLTCPVTLCSVDLIFTLLVDKVRITGDHDAQLHVVDPPLLAAR